MSIIRVVGRIRSCRVGMLPESGSRCYGSFRGPMRAERTTMKTKTYSPEQIVRLLRQVEAGQAEGKSIEEMCRTLGIGETTLHRWKNQYGSMKADDVRRLKDLEKENQRLKQLVAELSLDNKILKEAAKGN